MKVIEELINTIQNEVENQRGWLFDGRSITNAYRKGKSKLVLEFDDKAKVTVRFKASGDKVNRTCTSCGAAKAGWPDWWDNVAKGTGLRYACSDCVTAHRNGYTGESEAGGPGNERPEDPKGAA